MIAAVKWLYMVGTSEPQRNKRKQNNGRPWNLHDLQGKYKLTEQPLKTTKARKVTSGWIFGPDSNMGRTDFSIKWELLMRIQWEIRQMEFFTVFDFFMV